MELDQNVGWLGLEPIQPEFRSDLVNCHWHNVKLYWSEYRCLCRCRYVWKSRKLLLRSIKRSLSNLIHSKKIRLFVNKLNFSTQIFKKSNCANQDISWTQTLKIKCPIVRTCRHYFALATNPGEQFYAFTSITAWLLQMTGQHFEQPQEVGKP